jgi:hypothetical protein
LQQYLSHVEDDIILNQINQEVEGVPPIFYIANSNDMDILRTWVGKGGNVNARLHSSMIPLLAFAILLAERKRTDTTLLVKTLVSLGSDTSVIPRTLLAPFPTEEQLEFDPGSEPLGRDQAWCTELIYRELDKHLNLSQRYILDRHSKREAPSARLQHVASVLRINHLLGIHQFVIGQEYALKLLIDHVLSHLVLQDEKPLVLMFAGPSGHGKSEVGRLLGELMSLNVLQLDMAGIKKETDLCGARTPFFGWETGSPLNNFLASHSGERAIVFLDEFEKSSKEVWECLLIPLGDGKFVIPPEGHARGWLERCDS